MSASFTVGIDLGTTNCVVSTVGSESSDGVATVLPIRQLAQIGQLETYSSLPSFLYLPRDGEIESLGVDGLGVDGLPNASLGVSGEIARVQSASNPDRVVVAAKSWLCNSGVARTDAILPWQSPDEVNKVSPVEATTQYLRHLIAAWQSQHDGVSIANQDVVLTVPASFDPASRELTRSAAVEAGLPSDFVLLEEPQAAVYRWLSERGDDWRKSVKSGDTLLVVDVGGGTCDLTLVGFRDVDGELELQRLAVGNHLLVGGDNMDLAIAHLASQQLSEQGHSLDPWQSVGLWHACRAAKEQLLAENGPDEQTVSVLGRGSSLIASTISTKLTKESIQKIVLDGFFPSCGANDRPVRQPQSGFQDIGLPYEQDPAITKHVAAFLADHADGDKAGNASVGIGEVHAPVQPTHVLLNGGVFRSQAIRDRVISTIESWCETKPELLGSVGDLDTSVSIGAAYYGWSKRQGGIRIRGGTARSYYIGIETAGLAIPGVPRPLRAICVAPQGMEEGTDADIPGNEVGVVVGQPARYRFFASSSRPDDKAGQMLDRWSEDELIESESIELNLSSDAAGDDHHVPVRFRSKVTELGMFELWCHSTKSDDAWKMDFNVREDGG